MIGFAFASGWTTFLPLEAGDGIFEAAGMSGQPEQMSDRISRFDLIRSSVSCIASLSGKLLGEVYDPIAKS
jgi:hypothetical protein